MADTQQILDDVAALQEASAAAADQIKVLTDQVLALQSGQITDDQLENLHQALADVTAELVKAVEESQAALGEHGMGSGPESGPLGGEVGSA